MAGHRLLGLLTLVLSATCGRAWYTTGYPTRDDTTYWYPTTTADYPPDTTVYPTPGWTTDDGRYTTPDDRYTTPDDRYTTPDDRYTTPDDRYTTPDDGWNTTPDDRYTTTDGGYTSQEPPIGRVSRCPQGWTLYRDSCYVVGNTSEWMHANSVCRRLAPGGGLASIHDYSENSFLTNLAGYNSGYVWTGLFYDRSVLPGRYEYKWQDGTYIDFTYWRSGYPRHDPNQGCVYLDTYHYYGQWAHLHCSYIFSFFCKAPSTTEYLDVERDNYGCDYGFEGYGDNCYKFLPDLYADSPLYNCYQYYEADELTIKSADENDFVVERMRNNSKHQSPGPMLLPLGYYPEGGFFWNNYYDSGVPYHNFALEDMLTPMAHAEPKSYLDLSTGAWFISDTSAWPLGLACKKARRK